MFKISIASAILCLGLTVNSTLTLQANESSGQEKDKPSVADDGTVHVPAFELPVSPQLSEETRAVLKHQREEFPAMFAEINRACGSVDSADIEDLTEVRSCRAQAFYRTALYKRMREHYPVTVRPKMLAGVFTEEFVPKQGIAPKNRDKVLINVHGGAFRYGARTYNHLESVPVAALGKIRVVSIDYRMAPEYVFPAASEDVAAVYKEILKNYKPQNIGIYGCSAGGVLTAQSISWFRKEQLPLPGAVGMLCGAANKWKGDTEKLGWWMTGNDIDGARSRKKKTYYDGVDKDDPLVTPGMSDDIMQQFPPSLLVSSTRDAALSTVIVTHRQLTRLGVETELQLWEGMGHAFIYYPDLPESREVSETIVRFFDAHLGRH